MVSTEEPSGSEARFAVPGAKAKSWKKGRPRRIYLSVGFVTLLIAATMWYSLRTGAHMTEVYAPLVGAAMEIKLEAALGHLWFEEVISGDRHEDIATVWEHLERSAWYATAMLEGGQSPESTFIPLENPGLRREIEEVLRKITDFRAVAEERFAAKERAAIGTEVDQRFDALFEGFLAQADHVETSLQLLMASELRRFRTVQVILIAVCIGMAALVAIVLGRYDRKRTQALLDLHASEENLAITLNSIGDAVIATDTDGQVTRMNPVAEALTGWTATEAVGRPLTDVFQIVNAQTRAKVGNPVEQVRSEGVVVGLANHTLLIARDGTERQIADSGAPIRGHDGTLAGVVLVFRDVTEAYAKDRQLRESEERFQMLFEQAPLGYHSLDSEGRFINVNQAWLDQFGYARDEVLGRWFGDFLASEYVERFRERFPRFKAAGRIRGAEFAMVHKDGSRYIMSIDGDIGRDEQGKFKQTHCILRDITEQKRAEEALAKHRDHLEELVEERSRQLEASRAQLQRAARLASVGTLAAGIAHEINNPLGLILMSAQRALEKNDDPKAVETSLRRIKDDVKRCARIVKSVLQFSREQSSDKWPVDVNQCVRRSEEFTRAYADRNGVQLLFECASDLPAVAANPTELEQAFVNLIHNAVEACGDGQTVTLRTERAPVGVRITIADQGRGMTAEEREHAFDPFYTTRQLKGGTGLGLSIVHGIINEQGGTIDIDSQPGRGTRVIIELPVEVSENSKE